MSYLVLARKWRPRRFAELVGQEHVVRALTNALETGRVHHAFLFTGTRGVGKTTIARIFAKSLNCERGTSAEPCGECETCLAIDAGRYIDLLEIDAASNTGVDNVRELIENAQYMPSRGKFKVYLIDEVHMLSKPAFNALLKTLEEPPGHVKFLFATTDPEKLLVTVLSRCLQFNLKRLDEAQIRGQIVKILGAEAIEADDAAVRQLAHAADGSLRDGLSLLDQAIAYTGGRLDADAVAAMLGTVDRNRVNALLCALADGDGARLLAEAAQLAEFSPDWGSVLDALAEALHRIQVKQLVPAVDIAGDGVDVEALAARLRPELVQLWYQMALHGRRDLGYAPSPRSGFEMSLLRMLAACSGDGGCSGDGRGRAGCTARARSDRCRRAGARCGGRRGGAAETSAAAAIGATTDAVGRAVRAFAAASAGGRRRQRDAGHRQRALAGAGRAQQPARAGAPAGRTRGIRFPCRWRVAAVAGGWRRAPAVAQPAAATWRWPGLDAGRPGAVAVRDRRRAWRHRARAQRARPRAKAGRRRAGVRRRPRHPAPGAAARCADRAGFGPAARRGLIRAAVAALLFPIEQDGTPTCVETSPS